MSFSEKGNTIYKEYSKIIFFFFLAMSRKCVLFGLISLIIHNKAECSPQTNSLSSVSCFRARDKKHKLDLKYCIVAWQQD